MKEWLILWSEHAVLVIDAMALVVVAYAATEAFVRAIYLVMLVKAPLERVRAVWLRFSRWLVAGLTFQLAADIIETSISTSLESLGRIAVIALVRTFLNYFLEKDVTRLSAPDAEPALKG